MEESVGVPMEIRPFKSVLLLAILIVCTVAHCRVKNEYFPATPDSVPHENRVADSFHLKRYSNEREIKMDAAAGLLKPVPREFCAKSLPQVRRYALPSTVAFIAGLGQEFFANAPNSRGGLVVDSAIRSRRDQSWLRRHNGSATSVDGPRASSHERGTTVDLSRRMDRDDYDWLVHRLQYYRAIGLILVIEERHCVHIFVIPEINI